MMVDIPTTSATLLAKVWRLTGVSPLLAQGLVRRALEGIGVEAERAERNDYLRALPQIRRRLAVYLPAAEVERRCASIEAALMDS
jgi:hypothetical protein